MSIKAFRWAKGWIADPGTTLSTFDAFVLLMIADHYDDKSMRAWPRIATLARETRLSPSSVKRSLKRLQDAQLVEAEEWFDNSNGQQLANRYCLPLFDTRSTPARGEVATEWDLAGHPEGYAADGTEILMESAELTRADKWGWPVDNRVSAVAGVPPWHS